MTFSSIFSNAVRALLVLSPWIISLIWRDAAADLARAFSVSFLDFASASFCSRILHRNADASHAWRFGAIREHQH